MQFNPATPPDGDLAIEPDLALLQEGLHWADHVALVYPNWWGGPPGLVKIAFERVLLPGFAFRYHDTGGGWDRLLAGRTAELLVTMDTPPLLYKWGFGAAGDRIMARRTLDFCGIKPVRATHFGSVRKSTAETRRGWLARAQALGEAGV
jgi:NAD(P)H dehydrogenase (quinone)